MESKYENDLSLCIRTLIDKLGYLFYFYFPRKYYYPPDAYNQSKLAQVLFTRHLQLIFNRDEDSHIQVHAVHPGVVDTDLFVHSSTTYVPWFKKLLFKVRTEKKRFRI